jgi:iron complex transport system substrate-binding protein
LVLASLESVFEQLEFRSEYYLEMKAAAPRIVSLLPSATEMVCALGLGDQLVGITHECDYPREIQGKPAVVRNALPIETMSQQEIDAAVSERVRSGQSLYDIDAALLSELAPELIITQDLCKVCAASGDELSKAVRALSAQPEILWMTPSSLSGIDENLRALGQATGRLREAEVLIGARQRRFEEIGSITRELSHVPRVFCVEWFDPVYSSGHWVPEMVRIAGGVDELAREGMDSVRVSWEAVVQWAPEVLVLMPCGFTLSKVVELSPRLKDYPGWSDIPAVRQNRVYAVDANSYFARPGPRVLDGTELLAHLFHPDLFGWAGAVDAFQRLRI